MKKWLNPIICAVLCFGCAKKETHVSDAETKIKVVSTTGMVGDILKNIMGDTAVVTNLIKEGTDPHLYSPTRGDVALLMSADLVFYSGLYLEGRMEDVFKKIALVSHKETTLSTFTSAGNVRRGLNKAGFKVEKVKGFGSKRHMLAGSFVL